MNPSTSLLNFKAITSSVWSTSRSDFLLFNLISSSQEKELIKQKRGKKPYLPCPYTILKSRVLLTFYHLAQLLAQ